MTWFPRLSRDVARDHEAARTVQHRPGAVLDAEGVDEPPTPYRDDSIAEACRRLLELHNGPDQCARTSLR